MTKTQWKAKKSLGMFESDMQRSGLKRALGKWSLTAIGIGCVIGAGIFVMTGLAARDYAGPALALSFLVAGTGCAFAALCYAEFASIIPVEGSTYAYAYATMGELFAWIIGWDLILEYAMAASTVAVGWSGYFLKLLNLLHIHLPLWLSADTFTARSMMAQAINNGTIDALNNQYASLHLPRLLGTPIAINLPAVIACLIITYVLMIGIREASNTNTTMVIIKVLVVVFVILAGAFYVHTSNWSPFIPAPARNGEGVMVYGFRGIMAGAAYVFFAYIGFDAVSTQAGEARNPRKDVPFGLIASLLICTILYILVSLVITGMVRYTDIDVTAPIAAAFEQVGMPVAVWLISIAAVAGLTSVLLVTMLAQSRLFLAMAQDGLLPRKFFGTLHKKYRTPFKGTLVTGLAVAFVAGVTPIETIAKLVNIGTLFAFVIVCLAVLIMRKRQPDLHREFRTPRVWIIAPLGILFNVAMMLSLEWENWVRLVVWLAIGLIIYFSYSRYHSNMRST